MSEADAMELVDEPVTTERIAEDLRALGVRPGMTLVCHASLSALGWVSGDGPAVVDALQSAVTAEGTLVMPTHTPQNADPAAWTDPPVPDAWVDTIRATRPPYRPAVTPTRGIGRVAECFRTYPAAVRSDHPVYSFAVWGADAAAIAGAHPLDDPLGPASPLGAVYDRAGSVLMLGTDHGTNTSLHLAEHLADVDAARRTVTAPILDGGTRREVSYEAPEVSPHDFPEVGDRFERGHRVARGSVGAASARLIDQRALVDFAADWFTANR